MVGLCSSENVVHSSWVPWTFFLKVNSLKLQPGKKKGGGGKNSTFVPLSCNGRGVSFNSRSNNFWRFIIIPYRMALCYRVSAVGNCAQLQCTFAFLLILSSLFACWMGIGNPKNTLIWRSPFHLLKAWDQRKHISTLIRPHPAKGKLYRANLWFELLVLYLNCHMFCLFTYT